MFGYFKKHKVYKASILGTEHIIAVEPGKTLLSSALAKGILEIVFSPNPTKTFPKRFFVAKPKIVIINTKKHSAIIKSINSDNKGAVDGGS